MAALLAITTFLFFCGSLSAKVPAVPADTTIRIDNKRIEIKESYEKRSHTRLSIPIDTIKKEAVRT